MNRELFRDISQLLIALVMLAGGFYFLNRMFFGGVQIPPTLQDSATLVTGTILTLIGGVSGYFLGTSISSARKDSIIASKAKETP